MFYTSMWYVCIDLGRNVFYRFLEYCTNIKYALGIPQKKRMNVIFTWNLTKLKKNNLCCIESQRKKNNKDKTNAHASKRSILQIYKVFIFLVYFQNRITFFQLYYVLLHAMLQFCCWAYATIYYYWYHKCTHNKLLSTAHTKKAWWWCSWYSSCFYYFCVNSINIDKKKSRNCKQKKNSLQNVWMSERGWLLKCFFICAYNTCNLC
jgi:hypothetical protein